MARDDLRFGLLMAQIANMFRDEKKTPEPITPAAFFPSLDHLFEKRAPAMDPDAMLKIFRAIFPTKER